MKNITPTLHQEIPDAQVDILKKALASFNFTLKEIDSSSQDMHHLVFDVATLQALLNKGKVYITIGIEDYEKFTADNGIDFPKYIK